MLGARASRICGENRRTGAKAAPKKKEKAAAHLTIEQIHHQWQRFSTKMLSILTYVSMMQVQMPAILGKSFKTMFEQAKRLPRDAPASSSHSSQNVFRMIGPEAVGKLLRRGQTLTEIDPNECTHPDHRMLRRGNSHEKWWQCNLCASRWLRFTPASQVQEQPQDEDVLTFGKYAGKTHLQVYTEHQPYCQWAIQTATEDRENADIRLINLANYCLISVGNPPKPSRKNNPADHYTKAAFPDNDESEFTASDMEMWEPPPKDNEEL